MKALKISLITFGSLFVIAYLAFLFAVPAFVKLEDYNYELNNDTNPNQGLIIKFENVKVSTTWNLSAGVKVGQINAFYKNGDKFAQIDNIDTTISLPYLVFKKIKINKLSYKMLDYKILFKIINFLLLNYIWIFLKVIRLIKYRKLHAVFFIFKK